MIVLKAFTSFVFIITGITLGVVQGDNEGGVKPERSEVLVNPHYPTSPIKIKVVKAKPRALPLPKDAFWDELARCETASNWQDTGRYAGGLGIYTTGEFPNGGTWERWGGEEFAPTPQEATREEQIIVANRIAILGYKATVTRSPETIARYGVPATYEYVKNPVGFGGWGALHCAGGRPPLFYYKNTSKFLTLDYSNGQQNWYVIHDLQGLIGVKQDGIYGESTRRAHEKYLKAWGLPLDTLG